MVKRNGFHLAGWGAIVVLLLSVQTSFAQQTINWGTQADSLRGRNGQQFTFVCPAQGTLGRLWGTDVYTDDSSICTAAVHAGLITTLRGGTVTIQVRPGASSYSGTSRNGATSNGYGSWSGSFVFVGGQVGNDRVPITWETQADSLQGGNGQRFTLTCPAQGALSGRLWGTDFYTDDSSICTAAVHAGLITAAAGGTVTIEIRPGASSYPASSRNGVSSRGYGSWRRSFVFVGGKPGALAGCGLGARWEVVDANGGWSGIWARRGNSNVFDALWRRSGERDVTGTLSITISGSRVTAYRNTDPNRFGTTTCTYAGTLAGDGASVTGLVSCNTAVGPVTNLNWSARIICSGTR